MTGALHLTTAALSDYRVMIAASTVLSVVSFGVTVFIDRAEEEAYIDVAPGATKRFLRSAEALANFVGYEIMPEAECPVEIRDGGVVRHWLAEMPGFYPHEAVAG